MNTDTRNIEHANGGDDSLILTEQVGRRLSIIEIAQVNVSIANAYSASPHLLTGMVGIENHYRRKDFTQMQPQPQAVAKESTATMYDKEINKLDPVNRTETTPPTNEQKAREAVAKYAAIGMTDIEDYLAGQQVLETI